MPLYTERLILINSCHYLPKDYNIKKTTKGKRMTTASYIQVRIDSETKQQAIKILKSQGWNMSDFLRYAVQSVVEQQAIPFKREVPKLSEMDKTVFGKLEQKAKTMTIDSLMKELGIS